MITLYDCLAGISAVLENTAKHAPIYKGSTDDITEPGLYIIPTSISTATEGLLSHDVYELTVGWYATGGDDRYIDLIAAQDILASIFSGRIDVGGYFLYPQETSFELDAQEGTIFCTFTVELYQYTMDGEQPAEIMQTLQKKEEFA